MSTARIKTSYPRSCDALGVCQARGADQCCTHDCLEGRACAARTARTTNGGQRIDTGAGTASELPVVMLDDAEPPRLGSAVTWFAVAALATTAAAWLGLLAGLWSATP